MKETKTKKHYEMAVEKLAEYCEQETDLQPFILEDTYPFRVQFLPKPQLSIFSNDNIDENGEVGDMVVTVGLSTTLKSTLKFKMNAKMIKKIIKLAESVGNLYYLMFCEEEKTKEKQNVQSESQ